MVVGSLGLMATVHGFMSLTVKDRNAKTLFYRPLIDDATTSMKREQLGLKGDLSTLDEPAMRAKISAMLQARTRASMDAILTSSAY
jgi:hypothetical protein